jgi:hypothetical protein
MTTGSSCKWSIVIEIHRSLLYPRIFLTFFSLQGDLKRFLMWGAANLGYPSLKDVVEATPTAELEPLREGQAPQTDEVDMGMHR